MHGRVLRHAGLPIAVSTSPHTNISWPHLVLQDDLARVLRPYMLPHYVEDVNIILGQTFQFES
jgi:hypothetical protein